MPSPEETMYSEAVLAAQSGDRARARDLLTRLLKVSQNNPDYWVWMSAVVDTAKERSFCLKEAIRIDPNHPAARRGLTITGAIPPAANLVMPVRYQKRGWQANIALDEHGRLSGGSSQAKQISRSQVALMAAALVAVIGLVAFAIFGMRQRARQAGAPVLIFPTDTKTSVVVRTSTAPVTAANGTLMPLLAQLKETYTPTPLYVNTPHSISESFRIGIRAYQRGDWKTAITYFEQSAQLEPDAADVLYYLGETQRQAGNLSQALQHFNNAIQKNPDFAPAYLGRARVTLAQNPDDTAGASKDITTALQKDPNYGEGYLAMASLQIQTGAADKAQVTLDQAAKWLPGSPLVYLYSAQAYLAQDDPASALADARKANQMDITLLLPYRVIGEVLQLQKKWQDSLDPLGTYTLYSSDDAVGWYLLARAQDATGDDKSALKSLDKALNLDSKNVDGLILRAQLRLNDQPDQAINDYQAAMHLDPQSFEASLGRGKALMGLNYPGDAYDQFEKSRKLALTDRQKAELLFWLARSLDVLQEYPTALRNYQALVALPAGDADPDWLAFAQKRIDALATKTPTPRALTATATSSATVTPTITRTPAPTQTRWPTSTTAP